MIKTYTNGIITVDAYQVKIDEKPLIELPNYALTSEGDYVICYEGNFVDLYSRRNFEREFIEV